MESAAGALQQQLVQQQLLLQQLMAQKQTQMQMAQAPQLAAQSKKARECYVGNLTIGVVNEVVLRDFFNTAMLGLAPDTSGVYYVFCICVYQCVCAISLLLSLVVCARRVCVCVCVVCVWCVWCVWCVCVCVCVCGRVPPGNIHHHGLALVPGLLYLYGRLPPSYSCRSFLTPMAVL